MGEAILRLECDAMNSDFAPSFQLPACPLCSSEFNLERPFWRTARHTSKTTGVPHYTAAGCAHALEVFGAKMQDDPEIIILLEEAWQNTVDQLFAVKVEKWPILAVEKFKRELAGKNSIRGMTERLDFGPETPTQPPTAAAPPPRREPAPRVIRDPASGETQELF